MAIDLQTWVPKLLIETPVDIGGTVITAEYWNSLWLLHREQGDDTSAVLKALIDALYASVLHATEGASYITNPELYTGGPLTVAEQLAEIQAAVEANTSALLLTRSTATALDHNDISDITGTSAADCHPISAITGLETALAAITAGAVSAFDHNDIGTRDAVDAHPIAAITGLATALLELTSADNILYDPTTSVAVKLLALEQAIAAITGGAVALYHNNILSRDSVDAHPISAITGLQAAINSANSTSLGYYNALLTNKQNKITASTADPSGGVDGDVWIKYG